MRAPGIVLITLSYVAFASTLYNGIQAKLMATLTPKTAVCNYYQDLFDNGAYLKTACFVQQSLTYEAAKFKCAENNMNLFIMTDDIVASQLQDAAQWKYTSTSTFFVNGKRPALNEDWVVYNIDGTARGPLNSNIPFYSNHEVGNCLTISSKYSGLFGTLPGECSTKFNFVCEHFRQTQNPPTLDTSKCLYTRDLYKSNTYLKSACGNHQSYSYDQARRTCASWGMNLFMFDSEDVDVAFFEATADLLKTYSGGFWWINGRRNPKNNEWSLYSSNRVLKGQIDNNFEFLRLNGLNGVSSGDCLRLSGEKGPYQGIGYSCSTQNGIMCEYRKLA